MRVQALLQVPAARLVGLACVLVTFVLVSAGCAGSGGGSAGTLALPPPSTTDAAARTPNSEDRASEYGTLWVAYTDGVAIYDVRKAGPNTVVVPSREIYGIGMGLYSNGPSGPYESIVDMAVGHDGALYALCNTWTYPTNDAANSWTLRIYPPGATGKVPAEQIMSGKGNGVAVALDTNVIDVLIAGDAPGVPHSYVASYHYASGNNPQPVRTLTFTTSSPSGLALDGKGEMYTSAAGVVSVYAPHLSGIAPAPRRTIALPGGPGFALGPRGDIWSSSPPDITSNDYLVFGLFPGNNGPVPDVTFRYPYAFVHGIAVDGRSNVFVGLGDIIAMYANDGTGGTATFALPDSSFPFGGPMSALAAGPVDGPARVWHRSQ